MRSGATIYGSCRSEQAVARIAGSPESGRPVVQRPGVRVVSLLPFRYNLFYAIRGDDIRILQIGTSRSQNSRLAGKRPTRRPAARRPRRLAVAVSLQSVLCDPGRRYTDPADRNKP